MQQFFTKVGEFPKQNDLRWILSEDIEKFSVNSLDECPHLQAGTCWWFAPGTGVDPLKVENERVQPIQISNALTDRPGSESNMKVFKNALRSRRHTAESTRQ